jgi:2Fe-2S ferredoxin
MWQISVILFINEAWAIKLTLVVKIVIENLHRKELTGIEGRTLLKIFQEAGQDWLQECGGKGRCTTCRFQVLPGSDRLSELTQAELHYAARGELSGQERLACQARVAGDCTIRVPDACKLPHLNYSD